MPGACGGWSPLRRGSQRHHITARFPAARDGIQRPSARPLTPSEPRRQPPATSVALGRVASPRSPGPSPREARHGRVGDFTVREPMVLGHEIVGHVAARGAGGKGPAVGPPVAVHPATPCDRDGQASPGHGAWPIGCLVTAVLRHKGAAEVTCERPPRHPLHIAAASGATATLRAGETDDGAWPDQPRSTSPTTGSSPPRSFWS
ncbi:alcohol dehydrogenase catalytic domain-containing protein [Streptomyces sp. NPDC058475]|uniref:alcohol dehydrogenase catalytic domain-containing protein n=1 Tax=Streptomyces sp. NPDC058475 TaxID=3346518 RepID=UPI00365B8107